MQKRYNCPKCRCGCLFEEKNKLICLNCGAEVSKGSAFGVSHVHHYKTYSDSRSDKPTTVPRSATVRTVQSGSGGQSRPSTAPVLSPRGHRQSYVKQDEQPGKKKKGCGFWLLIYFSLFWLLPLLFELLSAIF